MPSIATFTAVGVVALAVLVWVLMRLRGQDVLGELTAKRRGSSRIVSRAHYLEGMERFPVVIALTADTFYYENADLQASLELAQLDEIEYDDETATGHHVDGKALRLRSHGHCFEFLLDNATASEWQKVLAQHHIDEGTAQAV
jgi:hypothetical protein